MNLLKIIGAVAAILIGLWMLAPRALLENFGLPAGLRYWKQFLFLLQGSVPALLVVIGLLILWVEWDDMRVGKK